MGGRGFVRWSTRKQLFPSFLNFNRHRVRFVIMMRSTKNQHCSSALGTGEPKPIQFQPLYCHSLKSNIGRYFYDLPDCSSMHWTLKNEMPFLTPRTILSSNPPGVSPTAWLVTRESSFVRRSTSPSLNFVSDITWKCRLCSRAWPS